jgi:hypothetical protein
MFTKFRTAQKLYYIDLFVFVTIIANLGKEVVLVKERVLGVEKKPRTSG